LILFFFLFLHFLACSYWGVARSVGFSDERDWVPDERYEDANISFVEMYMYALHYALLACVGSNTSPTEFAEIMVSCCCLDLGKMESVPSLFFYLKQASTLSCVPLIVVFRTVSVSMRGNCFWYHDHVGYHWICHIRVKSHEPRSGRSEDAHGSYHELYEEATRPR
jgi:hypothetical protein